MILKLSAQLMKLLPLVASFSFSMNALKIRAGGAMIYKLFAKLI
jgi:hypothetical protein